jgi:hypothetical protein
LKGFWAIKISGNWRIVFRAPRENKQRVGGLMELLEPGRAGFEERVRSATATVGLAAYLAGAVRRRLMRWAAEGTQLSASGIGANGWWALETRGFFGSGRNAQRGRPAR